MIFVNKDLRWQTDKNYKDTIECCYNAKKWSEKLWSKKELKKILKCKEKR